MMFPFLKRESEVIKKFASFPLVIEPTILSIPSIFAGISVKDFKACFCDKPLSIAVFNFVQKSFGLSKSEAVIANSIPAFSSLAGFVGANSQFFIWA